MSDDRRVVWRQFSLRLVVVLLLVGAATVAVDLFTSAEFPPRTLWHGLGVVLAVMLAALGSWLSAFVGASVVLSASLAGGSPRGKEKKESGVIARFWIAFLLCTTLAMGVVVAVNPTTLSEPMNFGGVDLVGYCKSREMTLLDDDTCSERIPLETICEWRFKRDDLKFKFLSGSARSGACLDRRGVNKGGIDNLPSFCAENFGPGATAKDGPGRTWRCVRNINMNAVCNWQFDRDDLAAVQEKGQWYCRGRAEVGKQPEMNSG